MIQRIPPEEQFRLHRPSVPCHAMELDGRNWLPQLGNGELRNYYTRYLATVTAHIGVLVTFSAHRSTFEERKAEFDLCVGSLRIFQSPSQSL